MPQFEQERPHTSGEQPAQLAFWHGPQSAIYTIRLLPLHGSTTVTSFPHAMRTWSLQPTEQSQHRDEQQPHESIAGHAAWSLRVVLQVPHRPAPEDHVLGEGSTTHVGSIGHNW